MNYKKIFKNVTSECKCRFRECNDENVLVLNFSKNPLIEISWNLNNMDMVLVDKNCRINYLFSDFFSCEEKANLKNALDSYLNIEQKLLIISYVLEAHFKHL